MAKLVRKSLNTRSKGKPSAVTTKRVRGADGQLQTVRLIDANSPTFGTDLLYVFRKNVVKARRENKEAALD